MSRTIRKAVIPAAGFGTRMLPATKAMPKEMLTLVDRPAIHYIVEEAVQADIRDILIVIGRDKAAIEDYFDRAPELERFLETRNKLEELAAVRKTAEMARIHFIRQPEPKGLGDAVLCAADHVGGEPFAVLLPDDLIVDGPPALTQLLSVYDGRSVVGVQRVPREQISRYGAVAVKEPPTAPMAWSVEDIVEKPAPADAPSDLGVVGRYLLSPRIFDHLRRTGKGAGGEIQLTDALRSLCREEGLAARELQGLRLDVGNPAGFVEANRVLWERRNASG